MKLKSLFPKRVLIKLNPPPKEKKGIQTPVNYQYLKTRGTVEMVGKDCKLKPGDKVIISPLASTEFNEGKDNYKVIEEKHVLVKLEDE